jgi:hypothetical protein
MEPILKDSSKVKGMEVLFFEDAQVEKIKGNHSSFAATGSLSVLYFSDYNRFVLQLNDWRYPLLRRLPITALDKGELYSRTYLLPTLHGFTFVLRIERFPNIQALSNFETILVHNSQFSYHGEQSLHSNRNEHSPDDKLTRHLNKNTGFKEIFSHKLKAGVEKIKVATETFKMGTKNLTSKKKKVNLKDVKTRNFRKEARSTFRKDFFQTSQKMSQDFIRLRKENVNLIHARNFEDLLKISAAPSLYINREDIEESILNNKSLAENRSVMVKEHMAERQTFAENLKRDLLRCAGKTPGREEEQLTEMSMFSERDFSKENMAGRQENLTGEIMAEKIVLEGMSHYSG